MNIHRFYCGACGALGRDAAGHAAAADREERADRVRPLPACTSPASTCRRSSGWTPTGGRPLKVGPLEAIEFPNVFVFLQQTKPEAGLALWMLVLQ